MPARPPWILLATALAACGPQQVADLRIELPELAVASWPQSVLLPGTPLVFVGDGYLPPSLGEQRLRLSGGGVELELPLEYIDEGTLRYVVDDRLLNVLRPGKASFGGQAHITRTLFETGHVDTVTLDVQFRVETNLEPSLTAFESVGDLLYPGDVVTLRGDGFLLQGEGHTFLTLDGLFETKVPPETRLVKSTIPANGISRQELRFELGPNDLGIRPGVFTGRIKVLNASHAGEREGQGLENLVRRLEPPRIDTVMPQVAARGQRIRTVGRGFLPTDPATNATTLIRLEGAFTAAGMSQAVVLAGPTALALFPDGFDGNTAMEYVLRVTQTPGGELEGLGLVPGRFEGVVSPMIISGAETILGLGAEFAFDIAPQRQIVFIKYLPGFSTTVAEMGLGPVESEVKQRILTVCERDYAGVNIEFRDERPTDFVEYSIIEVGGRDPNHAGLFGLDNTAGKDVGNLRFNDVIGGANAETAEQGYYAYGGVFVHSFFQMSPTLPGIESLPIASPRFDDIFGPFMPALGGTPVAPGDSRTAAINQAVRVLGNLVGNTVTHEIGHSLGLSNIDGEFHNIGDNDGWIMDSGNFRPFSERAEIDGAGPGVFSPNNRSYLERILPVQ